MAHALGYLVLVVIQCNMVFGEQPVECEFTAVLAVLTTKEGVTSATGGTSHE